MAEPEFLAPRGVEESLLALEGEDALALAGGTSTVVLMKEGLVQPRRLVWLGRIEELRGIRRLPSGELWMGAMTALQDVADSALVAALHPALAQAAGVVGNPRVRAMATLGGALAHADPRQDVPPALLALGAGLVLRGPAGERRIPLAGFFRALLETSLGDGELITAVLVPAPAPGQRSVYLRFTPGSQDDYPTVGVAARFVPAGAARSELSMALAGVGSTALLLPDAAGILAEGGPAALAEAAEGTCEPVSDRLGSAAYKAAMAAVWTVRALDSVRQASPPVTISPRVL